MYQQCECVELVAFKCRCDAGYLVGKWGLVSFAAHHSGSEAGYLKAADGVQRSDLPPVERKAVRIQHNIRESNTCKHQIKRHHLVLD